jgi:excinuclease ABC subunit C
MKQCAGPCVGLIDAAGYAAIVEQVILFLEGRSGEVEQRFKERIQELSDRLEFEQAAALRDRLYELRRMMERQRAVHVPGAEDRDVFGLYGEGRFTEVQVLFYRGGKMTGGRTFSFERSEMPRDELLASLLLQYYSESPVVPQEVLIPVAVEDAEALSEVLSEQRGARVRVHCPARGEKAALVALADRNARRSFESKRLAEKAKADTLEQLKAALHLAKLPERIECFDISTIQGTRTVASKVCFTQGEPDKGRYRRYSIRNVEGQDDFAAMREVLLRRFSRGIEEDDLPDLVLIDGGKGQLNVATAALQDLGIEDLPHAAIAKSRLQEAGERSPERIFLPGRSNPLVLPQNGPVVHLLARIRDEAHRFAIGYHRNRRTRETLATALTDIPGVGPRRARALLNALGSIARIRAARIEDIAAVKGFSPALAEAVLRHLDAESA